MYASAAGLLLLVLGQAKATDSVQANPPNPEIEFRVLLIIKRESDSYSPVFLPVRAKMTDVQVAQAKRAFEVFTRDSVNEITNGKVRFVPTVHVSETPLRNFDPQNLTRARWFEPELMNEFYSVAKPGEFDCLGTYIITSDPVSGYSVPSGPLGLAWFDSSRGLGRMMMGFRETVPWDAEIYIHEWMHNLDQFYYKKAGVKLPEGTLHGHEAHGYRQEVASKSATGPGWMHWYKDYLNCNVREGGELTGLGSAAWKHGPIRSEAPQKPYRPVTLPEKKYPEWVYELMKGDVSRAVLGPPLLETKVEPGAISSTPWKLEMWDSNAGTKARVSDEGGGTFVIENPRQNAAGLVRQMSLPPLKNYVFVADVRTEGVQIRQNGGKFAVNLYAGESTSTKDLTGTNSWTRIVIPFLTPEVGEPIKLQMRVGGHSSTTVGKAFFKNVQVRQVGYPLGATALMTETKGGIPYTLNWREWGTADGKFKTSARFVRSEDGKVRIQKRDGNVVDVAIDLLREPDKMAIEAALKHQQP